VTEELKRIPAGRLNGIHAETGTVLGPKIVTREYVVVTGNDEHGLTVGYATQADLEAIIAPDHHPRSMTEFMIRRQAQDEARRQADAATHRGPTHTQAPVRTRRRAR
jgi:hypothetical protein